VKHYVALLGLILAAGVAGFGVGHVSTAARKAATRKAASGRVLTIFIRNQAPRYISDRTIRHDIPAWEQAANKDFAPEWGTPQVKLVLSDVPPPGAITAWFVNKGNVQGALAYHTVTDGAPKIVVYAGTGAYYGYNNSVSFTHELFELLADPTISQTNQGWPYPYINVVGQGALSQDPGTFWFQEVCDPVEESFWDINHVQISDFITPNWFNDETGSGGFFDWMGVTQAPFTIERGGYASWWDGSQWNAIFNFRNAPLRDPAGFFEGEKQESVRR
jgi:hypothetical protein